MPHPFEADPERSGGKSVKSRMLQIPTAGRRGTRVPSRPPVFPGGKLSLIYDAAFSPIRDAQAPAVGLDDGVRGGQADRRAAPALTVAGNERLEHPGQQVVGNRG